MRYKIECYNSETYSKALSGVRLLSGVIKNSASSENHHMVVTTDIDYFKLKDSLPEKLDIFPLSFYNNLSN